MVVHALNASPYKIWPFLEAGKESLPNVRMEILIQQRNMIPGALSSTALT